MRSRRSQAVGKRPSRLDSAACGRRSLGAIRSSGAGAVTARRETSGTGFSLRGRSRERWNRVSSPHRKNLWRANFPKRWSSNSPNSGARHCSPTFAATRFSRLAAFRDDARPRLREKEIQTRWAMPPSEVRVSRLEQRPEFDSESRSSAACAFGG